MKHYKSYNQISEPYSNNNRSATQYTPVSEIPMMQELAPTGFTQPAIRNTRLPPHMKYDRMRSQMDQYQQEQQRVDNPYEPIQTYLEPIIHNPEPVSCKQFVNHVEKCKACYKLYKRNNTQGALIIFLVFIIILLLTKLMDKK